MKRVLSLIAAGVLLFFQTELAGAATKTFAVSARVYLGVVTKDQQAAIPDPVASEVFANSDRSGAYDGSLVFTATVN